MRPPVEIPGGSNMKRIPRPTNERGCAIAIVSKFELSPVSVQVPEQLRVAGDLDDVEGQPGSRVQLGDRFSEDGSGAEPAFALCAHEVAGIDCLNRVREAGPKKPISWRFCYRPEREHVWPDFRWWRSNPDFVRHHRHVRCAHRRFSNDRQTQYGRQTKVQSVPILTKPNPPGERTGCNTAIQDRRHDDQADGTLVQDSDSNDQA